MTPDTVDWDNVKKTDAYGIPIVFMLFGIGLLLIYRLCEKISVNSKTVIKVIYWSD